MRYRLPSWMSSKLVRGLEAVWEEAPLPSRATSRIPDARPLGTFENQDGRH